ncbi:MAG: hypothetical protein H8E13_03410 [Actinobacteria bacterium]|nr:hypothetical protein [Actinomycetota bacterium]
MDPQKIIDRLSSLNRELSQKNGELQALAVDMNEKEREYRVMYAAEVLRKKDEGLPATLIKDIVNGVSNVAGAKFNYQVAVEVYHIARERIKDIRTGIDTLRSFLTWLRMEMGNASV